VAGPGRPARVDRNAKRIYIERAADGNVKVFAEYRVTNLPSPGKEIGERIVAAAKEITHIEEEKGETPLAIGIRDSSLEIRMGIKKEDDVQKVTLEFGK